MESGRPVVIQNFLDVGRSDEVHRLHERYKGSRQPVMLCGRTNCVNHEHFCWRDKGFYDTPAYEAERRVFLKLQYIRGKGEKTNMAEVSTIRQELSAMSEDELREVIRGQRKLRREPTKAGAKKRTNTKKKPRAEQVQGDLAGLTREQRMELLKMLGGEPDA